jgi:hypothetical protein
LLQAHAPQQDEAVDGYVAVMRETFAGAMCREFLQARAGEAFAFVTEILPALDYAALVYVALVVPDVQAAPAAQAVFRAAGTRGAEYAAWGRDIFRIRFVHDRYLLPFKGTGFPSTGAWFYFTMRKRGLLKNSAF